ncbi:MAG: DUF4838 domain-containing protein, partial [Kiritimatiellae bacterium]|nr:DUF4838 domain-containing protein [Kiritimatiellia bacterium]
TYFEKHPEYFSLVDGARRKDGQICLTNPEVLEIVTSNLLARIRRDPGAKFYSVSQDDNWHRCQCDGCKVVEKEEESAAGPIIRFVNAIAEKVEKEFPNALIHTFAYNYSTKPPAKTKPHKNVVVQLCTDACEHARPIRGNAHGGTAAFQRNLEGWALLTDKLFIWDYTTDFRLYTLPWPNVLSLQDNLRLFRENGVKMVFAQGDNLGRHADWAELKAWLLAKWMWNPDLPMEGLLEDFFQGYYGAAAPYVRRYFDEIHRRIMTPAPNGTPRTLGMYAPDASQAIDADFLAEAAELFRKAEESVRDDQLAAYNVRMTAFPPDQLRFDRQYKVVDLSDADGACAGLSNAQALARSLFARRVEAKNLRLVEADGRDAEHTNRWAEVLARKTPLNGGGAYGEVEDWALELRYGGRRVSDPKAADGKAIMIFGNHSEWSVYFQMRFAAFKPNAKYRLRVRLRAETIGDGEAFSAGVHRGGPCVAKRTSEVSGDYAWYDVAVWKPDAGQCLWIAPGRFKNGKSAIKALYIDKIDFALADAPEPIKWSGGAWDETGAPAGALLTDNVGWWGRSVFTGVSYTFAEPPAYTGDPHFRRLLDGHGRNPRLRRVGIGGGRPLVATFDFKRPCVFNEVVLMAAETTNAAAMAEVSADGTNWTAFAEASGAGFLTRLRPDAPACGRYLRVTFRSLSSDVTLLDEVMAWGEGEVSGEYPENIRPIPRGNALRMASATNGVVEIIPIADPTAKSRQVFGHPKFTLAPADVDDGEILMARNETETRYFAVANGTTGTVSTTLSSPDFGQGVKAELRIGGLVRTQKPKIALTEQQKFDMLITGDEPANAFDHGRVGILPFFNPGNVPQENFARKYLANPEQVAG